ncbi:MAG: thermonuclease family protein [Persephonella sp.]|nr:thermonuclease family protein [Persephonella sp.]
MLKSSVIRVKTAILILLCFSGISIAENRWKPPSDYIKAKVIRVIDGDTIIVKIPETTFNSRKTLKNLRFTVRLIGIDTPESKPNRRARLQSKETERDVKTIIQLGKRAKRFTENLLSIKRTGKKRFYKTVFLEFDIQPQDRYGRLLAYVWLSDGRMLNREIICEGYAYPLTIPPNVKYQKQFLRCFREAREKKKGLWR